MRTDCNFNILSNQNQHKTALLRIAFFSLFFIANPFFATIALFLFLSIKEKPESTIYFSCFLFALFLGLINATKVPENDLIWYLEGYLDAKNTPFLEYIFTFGLTGTGKELAFPAFNYIIYQIIGANVKFYLIIYTVSAYTLLNIAVYKFGKALKTTNEIIILSIIVMSFMPFIFTMSAILLRQFLADALLMYISVNILFYQKKQIIPIILMVLTHSSSLLFVPLLFIPFFKRTFNKKTALYYFSIILILFGMQKIASILQPIFSSIPILNYALKRASTDTTFDLGALSVLKTLTTISTSLIPLTIIYFLQTKLKQNKGLVHFIHILTFLVLFILANLHQSELSTRLNFYVWQFFPFIFLVLANYLKFQKITALSIGLFLIAFFVYYLDIGIWTYTVGDGIFYYSIFNYII